MTEEYSGKPLAYLDQNILDLFSEYKEKPLLKKDSYFFRYLQEEVQTVYSPITLEEIYRSVRNGKSSKYGIEFLDILKELNAHYIELTTDKDGVQTNNLFRSWDEPYVHFNNYIQNIYLKKFTEPSIKNLFALYGGVKDFEGFKTEQIEALDDLLQFLERSLSHLENRAYKDDYLLSQIEKYNVEIPKLQKQRDKYLSHVQISTKHLAESNKNQPAHKELREKLRINHDNLQKIKFPNALEKIWDLIQDGNSELKNIELDEFFQLKDQDNKKTYLFQKVNKIYNMLNLIGYYQDEDLHKEKRFIASFSDMSHASYGCFCEYLITCDKNFAQKTAVAYEYLNLATQVSLFKLK
ncbi:hypothetical protein [Acinetobacter shaoyimingii]|uniref:Uncharacterized protein n=1 Tax=Acinetobacter shaoyimingii TaxID=2715164 RepID=A0A6G8RXU5_9GAMM|nr:hypothetical protein [Acinetobacter shaoyimingii]QIO06694.1 hypothetical protein G8E00_12455 [Acinetobacter shaoyimingii]